MLKMNIMSAIIIGATLFAVLFSLLPMNTSNAEKYVTVTFQIYAGSHIKPSFASVRDCVPGECYYNSSTNFVVFIGTNNYTTSIEIQGIPNHVEASYTATLTCNGVNSTISGQYYVNVTRHSTYYFPVQFQSCP